MFEVNFIHSSQFQLGKLAPCHHVLNHHIKPFRFHKKIYWFPTLWSTENLLNKSYLSKLISDLKDDGFFVYDISTEPMNHDTLSKSLLPLITVFKQNNISLKKLIVLSATPKSLYKECEYEYMFFNSLIYNFIYEYKTSNSPSINKTVDKHFLCLSRKDTLERRYVNYLMHMEDIFDNGFVSHGREGIRIQPNVNDVTTAEQDLSFIKTHKLNIKEYLKHGFKRHYLDTTDMRNHDLYEKIYVNNFEFHTNISNRILLELVNETYAFGVDSLFITEKIIKPILSKNLFLTIANPFVLAFLKQLGFKTYSHIFDESYDTETDNVKRTNLVIKNLKHFCSIPIADCKKIYDDNLELLEYNYNHLLKTTWDFSIKNRVEKYITKVSLDY